MIERVDAVIHIKDLPACIGWFAVNAPEKLKWSEDEEGNLIAPIGFKAFTGTPLIQNGVAAVSYVRMTVEDAATFRSTPDVTILAEASFTGPETADAVYAALFADAGALALYDAVYDRTPVQYPNPEDEGGGFLTHTPHDRFGQLA